MTRITRCKQHQQFCCHLSPETPSFSQCVLHRFECSSTRLFYASRCKLQEDTAPAPSTWELRPVPAPPPAVTLSIEVHRRLFAVLSSVPAGPTVVTGEIPIFFVTGAVAVPHHSLCLIDPCRPCHKVLHRRYRKR